MDDQVTPTLPQSSAVRVFDELRGEVSLLRRGFAAERRDQPDHGPTLGSLATSTKELRASGTCHKKRIGSEVRAAQRASGKEWPTSRRPKGR